MDVLGPHSAKIQYPTPQKFREAFMMMQVKLNNLHPPFISIPSSSVVEQWSAEVKVLGSNLVRAVFSFFPFFLFFDCITMKGPREREASQPAYDLRFRAPFGCPGRWSQGEFFFNVTLHVLGIDFDAECHEIQCNISTSVESAYLQFIQILMLNVMKFNATHVPQQKVFYTNFDAGCLEI